jgi:hypothetical protein
VFERVHVEPRLLEQRRPIDLGPGLRLLHDRWHGLEAQQAPARVDHHLRHAGLVERRIGPRHRGVSVRGDEPARTLPIEEGERSGLRAQGRFPAGCRQALRAHVIEVGAVDLERVRPVRHRALPQTRQDLARSLDQHLGRLGQWSQRQQRRFLCQVGRGHVARERQQQTSPCGGWTQVAHDAGGRHDLRRRRLARGHRGVQGIAAGKLREQCARRGGPLCGILFETAQDRPLQIGVRHARPALQSRGARLGVLLEQLFHGACVEEAASGEHLVEQQSQREQVAARGGGAARDLLRRHVGGRAGGRLAPLRLVREREPEIRQARAAATVDHHVRGLEVAMHDALLVHRREPRRQVARQLQPLVGGQPPDASEQRRQVFPVHVLHGQERVLAHLDDVVDAAHVGVRHPAADAHLAVELLQPLRRQRAVEEFQRDRLAELDVVGAVDLAHPALAQERHDPVSAREHGPGRECGLAHGRTGGQLIGVGPVRERNAAGGGRGLLRAARHAWVFGRDLSSPLP